MRPFWGWEWPRPRSWRDAYAVIVGLLAAFLALAFLVDWLAGIL